MSFFFVRFCVWVETQKSLLCRYLHLEKNNIRRNCCSETTGLSSLQTASLPLTRMVLPSDPPRKVFVRHKKTKGKELKHACPKLSGVKLACTVIWCIICESSRSSVDTCTWCTSWCVYICIVNSQDTLCCFGIICAPLKDLTVPEPDARFGILSFSGFSITPSSSSSHKCIPPQSCFCIQNKLVRMAVCVCTRLWWHKRTVLTQSAGMLNLSATVLCTVQ